MSRIHREPSRPGSATPIVAADAGLHLVADQLLDDLVAGDLEPALVHVAVDSPDAAADGGLRLGLLPLDGRHPTELLVGFVAPADWHALGMVTAGWAYDIGERAQADRRRTRVHVVTLVSRSGELVHRTRVEGDIELARTLAEQDAPVGEQVDLLRLALELPTDPPPCDTDVYWAIEWLSTLLAHDPDEIQSWAEVVDAHPAMRLLVHDDDLRLGDFVDVASAFVRVCTWERLRRLSSDGAFPAPELTATEARWFDDGAFARFLLNRCPPLEMLRRQVLDHLPGHLAEQLHDTLARLGVPRRSWPDDVGDHAA